MTSNWHDVSAIIIWWRNSLPILAVCIFSTWWHSPFKQSVKLRLKDQFMQKWQESISQRGKCTIYRIIKTTFGFENYLNDLPDLLRKYFTKFRCRNYRLPIEAGVRSQVLRDMRVCQFCKTDIGDEFHYLLWCVHFKEERRKYIEAKFYIRPSTIYLQKLFKQAKGGKLKQLAIFAKILNCKFEKWPCIYCIMC